MSLPKDIRGLRDALSEHLYSYGPGCEPQRRALELAIAHLDDYESKRGTWVYGTRPVGSFMDRPFHPGPAENAYNFVDYATADRGYTVSFEVLRRPANEPDAPWEVAPPREEVLP